MDLYEVLEEIAEKKDTSFNTIVVQMIRLGMKVEQQIQEDLRRYYREVAKQEIVESEDKSDTA